MQVTQRVQLRSSFIAGVVPASLLPGELALNIADRRLFYGDATGAAVELVSPILLPNYSLAPVLIESGSQKNGYHGWLEPIIGGTEAIASLFSGARGGYGVIGASYLDTIHGGGAFGVGAFAINDSGLTNRSAWGAYVEGRRLPGVKGMVLNVESNVINMGSVVVANPYGTPDGTTANLWLTSGRTDVVSTDASLAIGIVNNGAKYQSGIIVFKDSLAPHAVQGVESWVHPKTLDQPNDYGIVWRNGSNGNISAGISSTIYNRLGGGYLAFVDLGVSLRNASNVEVLRAGFDGITITGSASVSGDFTLPSIRIFANDTEAAAATPPVPVYGVYQYASGPLTRRIV